MLTMTRSETAFASTFVVLFWAIAAVLVAVAHLTLDRVTPWGSAAVEIGSLIFVAYCYMRFAGRAATIDHAMLVGVIWLLLAIIAEIVIGAQVHHGWFGILGSPERPMLRNTFLFVWIFAPSLFARRQATD